MPALVSGAAPFGLRLRQGGGLLRIGPGHGKSLLRGGVVGSLAVTWQLELLDERLDGGEVAVLVRGLKGRKEQRPRDPDDAHGAEQQGKRSRQSMSLRGQAAG